MSQPLLVVPLVAVAVSLLIRAQLRAAQQQVYVLKPLATLLVILAAALSFGAPGARAGYTAGVLAGLALSLGGDAALMFESSRAARVAANLPYYPLRAEYASVTLFAAI